MPTVLIVEDEWAIADWLQALMEDEGYETLVASNGRQALELLAKSSPDVVLTDFMMPIMDGPALIQSLADNKATRQLPVIVMSSLPEQSVRDRCDGYAEFLRKPFREGDILGALSRTLNSKAK